MSDGQKLLTVKELAEELRVHPETIRRAYWRGRIPAFKICKVLRFDLEQVRRAMQVHGLGCGVRAGAVRIGDSRPRGRRPRRAPGQ